MNLFKGLVKKQLICLAILCLSLSFMTFGFHHHDEGSTDDDSCHISLYASPEEGQAVLKAISYNGTRHLCSYASQLSNFIPQVSPQITTPACTILLIPLEDTSVPTSLSLHTFSNRAPPAL